MLFKLIKKQTETRIKNKQQILGSVAMSSSKKNLCKKTLTLKNLLGGASSRICDYKNSLTIIFLTHGHLNQIPGQFSDFPRLSTLYV